MLPSLPDFMDSDHLRLHTRLDVPPRGGSTRVAVGANELVLETVRGGHSLLWHAGREARRHVLGLPANVRLALELRPPALPLRLVLRETLTLAPGARVNGYVQVPLVPTVCWSGSGEQPAAKLLDFPPSLLAAEWDDEHGARFFCSSTWFVRFPVHGGDPFAVVPLHLRNDADEVCSPGFLPLALEPDELAEQRARVCARPRRLCWDGSEWQSAVRLQGVPA
ncbi:MAG: hypothetical protein KDE27_13040 [Planctomycetes bacterium]|nr:hypothetical protein [Planctomycetota bacterium]